MKISKVTIKNIIQKVISEDRDALKDILDHENTEDVIHATHMSWEGGEVGETESENLVQPLDKAKAVGSDPVTRDLEVIDHPTGKVVSIKDRKADLEETIREIVRSCL